LGSRTIRKQLQREEKRFREKSCEKKRTRSRCAHVVFCTVTRCRRRSTSSHTSRDLEAMELTTTSTAWAIIGIAIAFKVLDYITLVRKLRYVAEGMSSRKIATHIHRAFPTMHTLTSPNASIGNVFPPNWRAISIGGMYAFTHKRRGACVHPMIGLLGIICRFRL
jgi:hypothetical protein